MCAWPPPTVRPTLWPSPPLAATSTRRPRRPAPALGTAAGAGTPAAMETGALETAAAAVVREAAVARAVSVNLKRGFTLPLVLAMIAILAIALVAGLSALSSLREETRSTLAGADFDITAATAEARLQYLL